jgi:hypothetical protein
MLKRIRPWIGCLALTLLAAAPAAADQWNDRTILRFSAPVMVPGATVAPGEYVFQLADTRGDRNVVQIFTNDGDRHLVTTTEAIPVRRTQVSNDVVVQLTPTDAGAPIAISGCFYPGSRYGHRFVYPDDQARDIASRTRSLVLSRDTGDGRSGTIHLVDAQGRQSEWRDDPETLSEWKAWQQAHPNANALASSTTAPGAANVAVARTNPTGMHVKVDDLEDNPTKYLGQRVNVDAEVEKVLGPRMFTIDEPSWGDLEGEIIVAMPSSLAALVKEEDRITVEGTMRQFSESGVTREWGWTGVAAEDEQKIARRPVLVADRIVGGNDNRALIVRVDDEPRATGTSGSTARTGQEITDVARVANDSLIGRNVHLSGVTVDQAGVADGFVIRNGKTRVFVLPALTPVRPVRTGSMLTLDGVILQMPRHMADRVATSGADHDVYIYALGVHQ